MSMFIVPITPLNVSTEIQPKNNTLESASGFQTIFDDLITQARETQEVANQDSMNLALGQTDDLHTIMINAEKAAIALELTVQVTSKAINAYNEIMRMQFQLESKDDDGTANKEGFFTGAGILEETV